MLKMFDVPHHTKLYDISYAIKGGSRGSFWGPPKFLKRGKTLHTCMRKCRVLVLNSYPNPPLSEILYPPLLQYLFSFNLIYVIGSLPFSIVLPPVALHAD